MIENIDKGQEREARIEKNIKKTILKALAKLEIDCNKLKVLKKKLMLNKTSLEIIEYYKQEYKKYKIFGTSKAKDLFWS